MKKDIKVKSLFHLMELTKDEGKEFYFKLGRGLHSSKFIQYNFKKNKFYIENYIDGTRQAVSPFNLNKESNVGIAIMNGHFYLES